MVYGIPASSSTISRVGAMIVLGLLILGASRSQAQSMDDVRIQRVDLGSGLYMLIGRGGNIGVSTGPDGVFVIDDQYAPLTAKIKAAIAEVDTQPIRFVINTHWHGDHTGGNENLAGQGALILAHDNARRRLESGQLIEAIGRQVPPAPAAALPVVTFDSTVTLHLNGQTIHAFHVDPAHTDGDAIVRFEPANVIHTGDVYVAGMYPFIDISSGGDLNGIVAAADRVLALSNAETKIVPGHGPLSNRADLAAWREMLVDVRRRVRKAIAAGDSLDAIIAARPTRNWDARYGAGFMSPDRFVTLVHQSLAP